MELPINPANQGRWEAIMGAPGQIEGAKFPPHLSEAVGGLWTDQGVQGAFRRRNELQLNDSAP